MPQLIFFAVVGVAAYFGYRHFVQRGRARDRQGPPRTSSRPTTGTMGTLVKDPKTGEYRLAKD